MATQTIVIAPLGTLFTAGTNLFGPVSVPVGVFAAEAHFAPAIYLSTTLVMTLSLELSQDGAATWLPGGSFISRGAGSIPIVKGGLPATDSWLRSSMPNPANPNRRLRGTAVLNEAISTYLRIVLES